MPLDLTDAELATAHSLPSDGASGRRAGEEDRRSDARAARDQCEALWRPSREATMNARYLAQNLYWRDSLAAGACGRTWWMNVVRSRLRFPSWLFWHRFSRGARLHLKRAPQRSSDTRSNPR